MSNEETAKDQPEENTDALAQANDLPAETPEDAAVSEIDDSSDGVGDTDVTEEVIQAAPEGGRGRRKGRGGRRRMPGLQ